MILLALLLLAYTPPQEVAAPARPRDPWVVRSVLDGRPRMITLALHDDLWAAYDATDVSLARVWTGDVRFDGAVYTTVHGPQPASRGWRHAADEGGVWELRDAAGQLALTPRYLGYVLREGRVTLRSELRLPDGARVALEETPDATLQPLPDDALIEPGDIGLRREFVARGLPDDVELTLTLPVTTRTGVWDGQRWSRLRPLFTEEDGPVGWVRVLILSAAQPEGVLVTFHPRPSAEQLEVALTAVPEESEPPPAEGRAEPEAGAGEALPDDPRFGPRETGVSVHVYDLGEGVERLPVLVAGQTPNVSRIAPLLDLREGEFGLEEHFLTVVDAFLEVQQAGTHLLRLVSDDGSSLSVDGELVLEHDGLHGPEAADVELHLEPGLHVLEVRHFENSGGEQLSLLWRPPGAEDIVLVPPERLSCPRGEVRVTSPGPKTFLRPLPRGRPGDGRPLEGVHPAFTLVDLRPEGFQPRVGGMDWLSDGRLVLCTWDADGTVVILDGLAGGDPAAPPGDVHVQRYAAGLAEPLGLCVVEDRIFVLQKQELTELVDHDDDGVADEYRCVASGWGVTSNFHEFAFGLVHKDGAFYANLAVAIEPGGASSSDQDPDRGSCLRIWPDGRTEIVARGLRTPNGIGLGPAGEIFLTDNQGDWLPVSKLVRLVPDAFFGSRAVQPDAVAGLPVTPPVAWLPQGEIGNSPSQPTLVPPGNGPYSGQMLHGDVTHGGIKRVSLETVAGRTQGCVFRFTQGLEAGVNRLSWGPDGALYAGGVGSTGNWGQTGKLGYGLQRLVYNGRPVFEMLAVRTLSNGLEIEFTEPLQEGLGWWLEAYRVEQWRYEPSAAYGGPKLDEQALEVVSASPSQDRRRVFLELPDLRPGHVVFVHLLGPLHSEDGQQPWSTEAWLTLNAVPRNRPGQRRTPPPAPPRNVLSEAERAAGWELLFDGRTGAGWHGLRREGLPPGWEVRDGALARTGPGGDILTDQVFEDFELVLDWKISPGGNSGIFFHVSEDGDAVWETGPEMQVLDNDGHADGRNPFTSAGANYALYAPVADVTRPAGLFNEARLVVRDGHVQHWLNGVRLLEYELGSPDWEARVAASKFAGLPAYGRAQSGRIALQDHGDPVSFRNIKIRRLDGD